MTFFRDASSQIGASGRNLPGGCAPHRYLFRYADVCQLFDPAALSMHSLVPRTICQMVDNSGYPCSDLDAAGAAATASASVIAAVYRCAGSDATERAASACCSSCGNEPDTVDASSCAQKSRVCHRVSWSMCWLLFLHVPEYMHKQKHACTRVCYSGTCIQSMYQSSLPFKRVVMLHHQAE